MAWAPTTEQILDLDGVRRRVDRFEFQLLDPAGVLIGELHPDAGRPPTVSNDTNREVRRQLSNVYLPASEATAINPLTDRVQLWMVLQNGVVYSLGRFLFTDRSKLVRGWGTEQALTLGDRCLQMKQQTEKSLGFRKGLPIATAAFQVATQVVAPADIMVVALPATKLAAPLLYTPGSSRLKILEDLMALLGALPPYFDRDDLLVLADNPDLTTVAPTLTYEAGGRIIADSIVPSDELLQAYNRFVAYDTSGQSSISGTYDLPDTAPQSIANRGGFVQPLVQASQGLETPGAAVKAAKALAQTNSIVYDWLEFASTADPRHETWDVVQALGEVWVELSWSIVCRSGGPMRHKLRKVH